MKLHPFGTLPSFTAALSVAFLTPACFAALDQSTGIVTGSNQISVLGATTASLDGVSFVNQGLVGVGRISANSLDKWGESFGSVSSLQVDANTWHSNNDGTYGGSFYTLPDRGYNSGTTFSDYAARVQQVDFVFTPYYGSAPTTQDQLKLTYNPAGSTEFTYNTGSGFSVTTGLVPDSSTNLAGHTVPYVATYSGFRMSQPIPACRWERLLWTPKVWW